MIENCPQLDLNLICRYKSGDHTRQAPADAKEYNEERDNPLRKKPKATEEKKFLK